MPSWHRWRSASSSNVAVCRPPSLSDIVVRFRQLPVLDEREPDDIVGYDEHGLPS